MTQGGENDELAAWRRGELAWALRWLAAEPHATIAAHPNVCTADEIALDINHWLEATASDPMDLGARQELAAIDSAFQAMTDRDDPSLWTDDAILTSPEWASQRSRARNALVALGENRDDAAIGQPRAGGPDYITAVDWPKAVTDRVAALRARLLK